MAQPEWLGWLEPHPVHRKVAGSIPSGYMPELWVQSVRTHTESKTIDASLSPTLDFYMTEIKFCV